MSSDNPASGASMAAQHLVVPETTLKVAPTDGTSKFNTIRIPLVPVACWRLNDPAFGFDSSFLAPTFRDEFTKLSSIVGANSDCPAALFGHCDPAGDDALNKTLGDRRATAVYALLTRQPDLWLDLYEDPVVGDTWGIQAVQTMLSCIVDAQGNPYYTRAIDGQYGVGTTDAVKRFQQDSVLAADGQAGPNTLSVLFGAYMDWLCTPTNAAAPFRMQPGDFLAGVGAQPGDLPRMSLQSCGKFNPIVLLSSAEMTDNNPLRNADDAANRRVIMFFFKKGTTVDSSVWPCPKVKEGGDACKAAFWPDGDQRRKNGDTLREYRTTRATMACRFYDRFARRSPCEHAKVPRPCFVYAQLMDDALDTPLASASYVLQGKGGLSVEGTTDAQGNMRQNELPDDVFEVQCCGLTELAQVYYSDRADDLGDQPWVLRMRKAAS